MAITGEQYDALVMVMRGDPGSPGNRAARLVMVEGKSQADAMRETGASRSTVHLSVKRWTKAYLLISKAFSTAASKPRT